MTTMIQGDQLRTLLLGAKVDRAAANLPQTATGALFNVTGGRVLVTSITGRVTTSIQAQANAVKLVATPSGSGTVNDLSATVDVNGLAAGGLLGATGLAGDALVKSTGGGVSNLRNPIVVAPGAIGLNTAASNTGQVEWSLTYVALDNGATVAAA
ncbi:hypothetical protein HD597_011300 [Nonomuraea thailandensis]|uniref:Uncharacterized protein n=1 Tax=Nonomuraea thailandensis TaxID=1188745 RepID=A0A9X2GUS4_9ACTN|nr:hypothetical protein [Nonomuraea thailandensis]MCP2364280.1 hypothetical protein [Nonomuraea thailandensis]